jgi:hypothetical protein
VNIRATNESKAALVFRWEHGSFITEQSQVNKPVLPEAKPNIAIKLARIRSF